MKCFDRDVEDNVNTNRVKIVGTDVSYDPRRKSERG